MIVESINLLRSLLCQKKDVFQEQLFSSILISLYIKVSQNLLLRPTVYIKTTHHLEITSLGHSRQFFMYVEEQCDHWFINLLSICSLQAYWAWRLRRIFCMQRIRNFRKTFTKPFLPVPLLLRKDIFNHIKECKRRLLHSVFTTWFDTNSMISIINFPFVLANQKMLMEQSPWDVTSIV